MSSSLRCCPTERRSLTSLRDNRKQFDCRHLSGDVCPSALRCNGDDAQSLKPEDDVSTTDEVSDVCDMSSATLLLAAMHTTMTCEKKQLQQPTLDLLLVVFCLSSSCDTT